MTLSVSDRFEIEDAFHCARLSKATQERDDGGVEGDAFALRSGEEYLSLNCLDLFRGDREEQLRALRRVVGLKLNVRKTALFSVINAGYTKQAVVPNASLDFIHKPQPDDETHCGLYGLEYNDELVQDLIAESVVEVVTAYTPLSIGA